MIVWMTADGRAQSFRTFSAAASAARAYFRKRGLRPALREVTPDLRTIERPDLTDRCYQRGDRR